MSGRADDTVALITGGASGIGLATAHRFAELGAAGVALLDRDTTALDSAAVTLADRFTGLAVQTITLDVTDAAALAAAFDDVVERHGRLDHVVNNAARMTGLPVFPDLAPPRVAEVLQLNVEAVVVGCMLAHEHLADRGGSVTCTASGAGKVPFPSDPLYGASKAAVIMFVRSAAATFAESGIRLNAVCPSLVDTPMLHGSVEGRPELAAALAVAPTLSADEVAEVLVGLALDPDAVGQTPSVLPET